MGCGCADRQKMLSSAAHQAARGNVRQVAQRMQVVGRSMAQDAQRVARNAANSQLAKLAAAARRR